MLMHAKACLCWWKYTSIYRSMWTQFKSTRTYISSASAASMYISKYVHALHLHLRTLSYNILTHISPLPNKELIFKINRIVPPQTWASASCRPDAYRFPTTGLGVWLMGKLGRAWVSAWVVHGMVHTQHQNQTHMLARQPNPQSRGWEPIGIRTTWYCCSCITDYWWFLVYEESALNPPTDPTTPTPPTDN